MPESAVSVPSDLVARGRGRKFWRAVTADFALEVGELELLAEVCRQLDMLDALRQVVAGDGPVVESPTGPRVHPGVVEQRLIRQELRRTLAQLHLPAEAAEDDDGTVAPVESFREFRARKAAAARWDR